MSADFHPLPAGRLVLRMQRLAQAPEVLAGVVEVQRLLRVGLAVVRALCVSPSALGRACAAINLGKGPVHFKLL